MPKRPAFPIFVEAPGALYSPAPPPPSSPDGFVRVLKSLFPKREMFSEKEQVFWTEVAARLGPAGLAQLRRVSYFMTKALEEK